MSDDHDGHDVLVAKCTAMACMFFATALFGGIPFMLNHYYKWTDKNSNARSAKIVIYLLHFGGGVLLATTFVHLLPEVQEVVEHLKESGQIADFKFAVPETLMCVGFILMYLIEECMHCYLHRNKKAVLHKDDGVGAAFERGHSVRRSVLVKGVLKKDNDSVAEENNEPNIRHSQATLTSLAGGNGSANIYQNGNFTTTTATNLEHNKPTLNLDIQICSALEPAKHHSADTLDHSLNYLHNHSHTHHNHSHLPLNISDNEDVVTSSFRGFGIVFALSLHEIFEGLAIGLEDDSKSVWFLFGAVSAHKLVLAFCVGVELLVARTRTILCIVYSFTFAIISPIGIGIGIGVSHNSLGAEEGITSLILQGIACGTLLYVVFFEILNKHAGFGAFVAMVIGFAVMFGLQNIGEGHEHHDHHAHDHDHDHSTSVVTTPNALQNLMTTRYQ